MRKNTPRLVTRTDRVVNGFFYDPSLTEVIRQFRKVRSEIGGVHLLEPFTDGAMKPHTLRVSRAFVESLADQRMRESPGLARERRYDADFLRLTHQLGQRSRAFLVDSFEQHHVEFLPNHGGDRQGCPRFRR